MSQSFGESYLTKVTQSEQEQNGPTTGQSQDATVETATIAGDITLAQLQDVLIALNAVLLALVPLLAWVLTGRTLRPVKQAYEQQNRFVSDASHELRTPLTIIKGELDLALKRPRTTSEYRVAIGSAADEIERLQRLVDNLLLLAQSERKHGGVPQALVDLSDVVVRVSARVQPIAKEKHITIKTRLPEVQPMARGDSLLLEQLVENVLVNAVKYSGDRSRVRITASIRDKQVLIVIKDSGPGMTSDVKAHIFDRFYRESTSRTEQGFGLGLPIAQMIARRHGGDIAVASHLGHGTTVTITLPLAA